LGAWRIHPHQRRNIHGHRRHGPQNAGGRQPHQPPDLHSLQHHERHQRHLLCRQHLVQLPRRQHARRKEPARSNGRSSSSFNCCLWRCRFCFRLLGRSRWALPASG
jgi:hypothetical protein